MMFNDFDDPTPPPFDEARWEHVRHDGIRARRRSLHQRALSIVAVATVFIVGIGVVINRDPTARRVVIQAAPTHTDIPGRTTSTAPADAWLTVVIHIDNPVVVQGDDITGTVTFTNHRSEVFRDSEACAPKWQFAVTVTKRKPNPAWTSECMGTFSHPSTPNGGTALTIPPGLANKGYLVLPPGRTTVRFSATTRDLNCEQLISGTTLPGTCSPGGPIPNMNTGPALLWFLTERPVAHFAHPQPIPITIVSKGDGTTIVVPRLVGVHIQEAFNASQRAGFINGICATYEFNPNIADGIVTRQTLPPGTRVSLATRLDVVIAGSLAQVRKHETMCMIA